MNTPGKKIILLIPYFGRLPWYFRYFVHSCKTNPGIHFLVVTDDHDYREELPDNVVIVHNTLTGFADMIARKLQLPVAIPGSYKLCDFRPAYGLIFEDYIKEYAFWGHCDIDLIFGNIGSFITEEVLCNYDIISTRPEYITGFFALYRNTEYINTLFRESRDYKEIFSSPGYTGFDECGLLCIALMEGKELAELDSPVESMTHLVKRLAMEGKINAYFDLHAVESIPGNLSWNKGELVYMDTYEVMLYHLVSFKIHPFLSVPGWKHIPDKFLITENSFSTASESK